MNTHTHRQHHTPAPVPMPALLAMLIDVVCAASVGLCIALAVYVWSCT